MLCDFAQELVVFELEGVAFQEFKNTVCLLVVFFLILLYPTFIVYTYCSLPRL